jgi:nucleotide-binding universal stress UspA family protein
MPPGRVASRHHSNVCCRPRASIATSTPRPPVSRLIAATGSCCVQSMTSLAPISRAMLRRFSIASMPMISDAPFSRAPAVAHRPIGPWAKTATVWPMRTLALSAAEMPVEAIAARRDRADQHAIADLVARDRGAELVDHRRDGILAAQDVHVGRPASRDRALLQSDAPRPLEDGRSHGVRADSRGLALGNGDGAHKHLRCSLTGVGRTYARPPGHIRRAPRAAWEDYGWRRRGTAAASVARTQNPGGRAVGTFIVGIEESLRGQDAVALVADVARASGAEVLAVCAYPYDEREAAHYHQAMRAPLREAAEATLARLCEPLSDLPSTRRMAVADASPARALLAAADATDAELIVVGSSHAGFSGHVVPGSTGARLLEGAPCAVALAPQGYRLRPHAAEGHIAVAYDGSPTARAALSAGAALAASAGALLRVVTVFSPDVAAPPWLPVPPGFLRMTEDAERAAREELERAVATVPGAEPAFLIGDPSVLLAREAEAAELLVIGSRNYGPGPAVLLGEVSGQVVASAACAVMVVPHGVGVREALEVSA